MQIRDIVLYDASGRRRILALRPGAVNIVTGRSKTGKTALIAIVDYCLGRTRCNVPEGVIRDTVTWYGIRLDIDGGQMFIARPRPPLNQASSTDVYVISGDLVDIPDANVLVPNSNTDALVERLGSAIGLRPNLHRTPQGQTRPDLQANFRHALLFAFQPQDEIASPRLLFHRQSDYNVAQALRDTLPYFLVGAGEDRLRLEAALRVAQRELNLAIRARDEALRIQGQGIGRAQTLLLEARQAGLIEQESVPADPASIRALLEQVARWTPQDAGGIVDDRIADLQRTRQEHLAEFRDLRQQLESATAFSNDLGNYSSAIGQQIQRLAVVDLLPAADGDTAACPLCQSALAAPPPDVQAIQSRLARTRANLETTHRERPRLDGYIAELQERVAAARGAVRDIDVSLQALMRERREAERLRDLDVSRAHVAGRVSLFLETDEAADETAPLSAAVDAAEARVASLRARLEDNDAAELFASALSRINTQITEWARLLQLEHANDPIRLDLGRLTLVVDRPDRPITLEQVGSGENWVGFHLATLLALHQWFVQHDRPVPRFLFLDQPTQVYFPPERGDDEAIQLADDDLAAVERMFRLIVTVVETLAPGFQVIVTDHANIAAEWFRPFIVETWRGADALVPAAWLADDGVADQD